MYPRNYISEGKEIGIWKLQGFYAIFHLSQAISYFLSCQTLFSMLFAVLGVFFMCLHFQKFIKYLQFANTLLHIATIMFPSFLYIPFANKSYHCDWPLTLTEHQVQIVIKLTEKIPRSRSKWKLSH